MKCLGTILLTSMGLLSCTQSGSDSSSRIANNPPALSVNVIMEGSLNRLYLIDKQLLTLSLRLNGGKQQEMVITQSKGKLIITGLAYGNYNILVSIDYELLDSTLQVATFSTDFQYSKNVSALTISAMQLDSNSHDNDNDNYSNLDELLARTNPIGTEILVSSPSEFTVTDNTAIIATLTAYAASPDRPLRYTLAGGKDQAIFSLDSNTGTLSFNALPLLSSTLSDNVYVATIAISDDSQSITHNVTVTISDRFAVKIGSAFKAIVFNWQAIDNAHSYTLWEKPPSAAEYQILASDLRKTAYSQRISLHLFDNRTLYKIEAFDAAANKILSGMEFRVMDKLLGSIGIFKDIPSKSYNHFGGSLSVSADGRVIAIGTPRESFLPITTDDLPKCGLSINYCEVGGVQLFSWKNNTWVPQLHLMPIAPRPLRKPIEPDSPGYGTVFGFTVDLSHDGKTLVVGVPGYNVRNPDINGNHLGDCQKIPAMQENCNEHSGAVFVYQYVENTWTLTAILKSDNAGFFDSLGSATAISGDGNTIAVGAPGVDNAAGAGYIFQRRGNTGNVWIQSAYLKASNPASGDGYGNNDLSLSYDGNTVAISAATENGGSNMINGPQTNDCDVRPVNLQTNCAERSGAVYVYRFVDNAWLPPTYIKSINTETFQFFGDTISLADDGLTLAVGALFENGGSVGINGNSKNDCSSLLAQQQNCAMRSGAAYIYRFNGLEWRHTDYIKPLYTRAKTLFGSLSLSHDGKSLAIGAAYDNSAAAGINGEPPPTEDCYLFPSQGCLRISGAVYFYKFDGVRWSSPVYIKAPDPGLLNRFGRVVALDRNGSTLLVTAPSESSMASGFNDPTSGIRDTNNRTEAGAVYIY